MGAGLYFFACKQKFMIRFAILSISWPIPPLLESFHVDEFIINFLHWRVLWCWQMTKSQRAPSNRFDVLTTRQNCVPTLILYTVWNSTGRHIKYMSMSDQSIIMEIKSQTTAFKQFLRKYGVTDNWTPANLCCIYSLYKVVYNLLL